MVGKSSDSNFELPPPRIRHQTVSSRVLYLSRSLYQSNVESESAELSSSASQSGTGMSSSGMSATARRLNQVVRHGLSIVNSRRVIGRELASNYMYPFLSQPANSARYASSGRARAGARRWKTIPCLLSNPGMTRVPSRDQMDRLRRKGLETLWFDKEVNQLEFPQHYGGDEIHFMLICLHPPLVKVKYEFCRAGGPSHHMIVSLTIDNDQMIPSLERPFRP